MRKKFTMLLASLFLTVGMAWAQTAELQVSTTVGKPECQYVIKSGNNYWMAANTAPTKHKLGRFAFFAVTETNDADDYKIYSIDLQKWVSYNKAGSYSNGKDFAKLVDSQDDAQPWNVVKKTVGDDDYYQIAPYNNTGVAAKYMNWNGGINPSGYSYDDTRTVGLWQNGALDDAGSRWTLAACPDLGSITDGGDIATTWNTSTWWTTADYGGSNVLEAVKAVETAQYPNGNSNVNMTYMHIEVPVGRLDVTLSYATGSNRLDIVGLDLLNTNGEVVVSDYHFGYSGNAKHLHTYTLPVETAGSYTLRYWVTFKSEGNTSVGNIAIAHASVAELKTEAKAELANLAKLSIITVGDAETQIDAVDANANPNAAINDILVDVKKSVDGKNLKFMNHGSGGREGKYLGYDKPNSRAAAVGSSGNDVIWTLKAQENGSFKLYNFAHDVYLGVPADPTQVIAAEADAPAFDFNVTDINKVALVSGNKMVHVASHTNNKLIEHNDINDGASLWTITPMGDIVISRELYVQAVTAKEELAYAIQQAYGLVTDAAKYTSNALQQNPEEGSYANLLDNDYESYFHSSWSAAIGADHYLQAEVSEEVMDFSFYFKKRHDTNNNRPTVIEIQGSSDGTEFTTITTINEGLPTDESQVDYFSGKISASENIKHIRFVVQATSTGQLDNAQEDDPKPEGHPYFHFSEFYIFPVMPDITDLIEAYNNFSALSITNSEITNAATELINAEETLALANIKKVVDALLKANESNHAATPALGQYTTAAYEALEAAFNDAAATQESLEAAIAKFEKAKNLPVFTIDGVIEYASGKSIYDNPGNTNAKGNTHYFKKTNEFDKTMWWALDLTASDLTDNKINGPKSSVGIYNVGTGAGFWAASTIDITETSDEDPEDPTDDDIFLFYANGGDPIHAQKDGALITRWESTDKGSGSAWKFSYIGSTFELSKYDDAYVAAYEALKTAHTPKSYMLTLFGDGIGQYSGDATTFLEPLTHATDLLQVPLKVLLQNYDAQEIVDATAAVDAMQEADILTNQNFTLNLPQAGKYYRIKGANAEAENYVTGNVRAAGDRIALQAAANDATVFQYLTKDNGDGILLAVESNLYLALNSWTFKLKKADAAKTEFAASTRKAGAYTIKSGGSFFHYDNGFLNRCGSDGGHTAHDWYLEEVAESEVPANTNLLTDISNLSADASYRIYGDRGFIYVADDGNMKGTNSANVAYNPNNNKHHFAIVTIGENKYLYNVGAKKFVMKNGTGGVALTDWPELAITIESKETANENAGFDWVIKSDNSRLNLSDATGHTFGIYTNYETEDEGNVWAIYKVGTFDPAEAQSMKKVTVNYTVDGQELTNKYYGVAANNAINFSYAFAAVTSCKVGEEAQTITDGACSVTVQDNMTIAVEIEQELPFEAAQAVENIPTSAWRYLQMHSNNKKYIQYLSDQTYVEWADANIDRAEEDSHTWALVGNVVEGFKLVNFEAGTSKALKSTGSGEPVMDTYTNGTSFVLVNTNETSAAAQDGFCLQYPGGNYLNAQSGRVKHHGAADAGSTLVASSILNEPEPGFYYISNGGKYLSDDRKSDDETQRLLTADVSAKNIFYYDGTTLIAYASGFGFEHCVCNTKVAGVSNGFTFGISSEPGKYTVLSSLGTSNGDEQWAVGYWKKSDNGEELKRVEGAGDAAGWSFEEVTELPVTITAVGYGTLWAPVALEIPNGIKAYTGALNADENVLELTKITADIIPAETGVVIYRDPQGVAASEEATTHNFGITSTTETIVNNAFHGSVATIARTSVQGEGEAYTLQADNSSSIGVAFKPSATNIASGKAYLVLESVQQAQALRIRFAGEQGGTTEIAPLPLIDQPSTEVYDLQGRRVLNPTKGMYIVNGKKVLF